MADMTQPFALPPQGEPPEPGAGPVANTASAHARRGVRALARAAWRMPLADKAAVAPAWLLLLAAAAAIRLVPFARLAPLLGHGVGPAAAAPALTAAELVRARFIRRAIERAVRLAPFRSDCLPQALVCAAWCRWARVPALVRLGVRLGGGGDGGGLSAHAWVLAGAYPITGGRLHGFEPVAGFVVHER